MLKTHIKQIDTLCKYFMFGSFARVEASSLCQLNCPMCEKKRNSNAFNQGYLNFRDFKNFVDRYPNFKVIELSGRGELFLNPEIDEIIKYASLRKINLTAYNGVNLNDITPKTIENLVMFRFVGMAVSIDGAREDTYRVYRRGGDFNKVINNIQLLNSFKKRYKKYLPRLIWRFIVFGHNEQEITAARELAKELNMDFELRLNCLTNYSPVRNENVVRQQAGYVSIKEWEQKNHKMACWSACHQLWEMPQITWEGGLLGCGMNEDPFGVNVFADGIERSLKNEKYELAKKMLLGLEKAKEDGPCKNCQVYAWRKSHQAFVKKHLLLFSKLRRMCDDLIRLIVPRDVLEVFKSAMRRMFFPKAYSRNVI
jgi:MoaA/NifB/PqqE/SkfB family radical SAM enzyme